MNNNIRALFGISILIFLFFSMPSFSEMVQYTYDDLNRITKAEYSDGTVIKYSYDAAGNRLSKAVTVPDVDSDGDGLLDAIENATCTSPNDADTDDDGILDGWEDANHNGMVDTGETDPCEIDSDADAIQDGTELGYTLSDIGPDTDTNIFQPDIDPATTTDPLSPDTDNDGIIDGVEDANHNGLVDSDETDPCNPDTDGDDLPDGWEVANGLNPLDATGDNGRDGDFDGDNCTNYQEYVGGSDPNDPESVPSNNAPTVPALNYPVNNGETTSREPILSVSNSTDLDGHSLIYTFEVYSDLGLTSLVTSVSGVQGGENTTEWQVDTTLDDNSFYYWRARAYDGIDYSEWMDTAKFFVNTSNDAPSIPNASMPPDNSEVTTLQPTLEVTNASDIDLDPLTYEFELYSDQNMSTLESSKTAVLEGNADTTSWQVDILLQDNASYWWRAQARDNEDEPSGWTSLFTFSVNTPNDVPTAPSINSPQEGEVDTLEPALEVNNSTDANLDTLTYFFEIDKIDTFNSPSLEQSPEITEGAGDITSWVPSELVDNTTYYWRVRAYDGAAYSQWTTGSFFVNRSNDPPTTPTINNPGDNSEVTTLTPTLVVNPSTDLNLDQISYDFELYSDVNLSDLATSTTGAETSWQVDVSLVDSVRYYLRARAVDEHGAASDWSDTVSFLVNVNYQPTAPTLNNPVSGGTVTSLTPTLSVNNSTDPDNDTLSYEFELYSDQNLSNQVASSTVSQGNLITSWTLSSPLTDNTTYYWRARANDGNLASSWMPTALFVVNTSGADGGGSSSDGGGGDSSSCFVATAAFGSPMESHVSILRNFRDRYLLTNKIGSLFVNTYNKYSPPVAHFIEKHETLKTAVRISLLPLVAVSYSALHFGLTITACGLLLIFVLPIFLISVYRRSVRG